MTRQRDSGTMSREHLLAAMFVELADTLVADFDVIDFLRMPAIRSVDGPCLDCFRPDAPWRGTTWPR
jgi:hypothetical protein